VGDYPYLLIPLIGPSNPRDLSGKVVDLFINPLHYITIPGGIFTDLGEESLKQGDERSFEVGKLDALEENEPDPYAAERHEVRTKRQSEIDGTDTDDDDQDVP
jgi:phospholipid-binding lipoprotein MlaA